MSPQKSKKYRREITPAVKVSTIASSNQISTAAKPALKNSVNFNPLPTAQTFTRDLTYIGLTALIVVVLMVVAYYVVPR